MLRPYAFLTININTYLRVINLLMVNQPHEG